MKTLLTALLLLLLAAGDVHASPASMRAAEALLADGVVLYNQGDFVGALDRFERGYAIYPNATLLMNIGTTLRQLGRNVEAANAYQEFLDDPTTSGPLAAEVRSSLTILDTTLGRLTLTIDDDVEIQIDDGAWLPASRAHLLRVAPGTFVVRARRGDRAVDVTGRIGAGEEQALTPVLDAPEPVIEQLEHETVAALEGDPEAPQPVIRRRTIALISAGAGVVALGAGLAFAIRSTLRYDQARALCGLDDCADHDGSIARSASADRDRLWAIGAAVVGVAAVSTGAVLWIKSPRHRGDSSAALTLITAPRELGLSLAGSF